MASQQTPDQQLVSKYSDKFSACAALRKPFEQEWYTNLAFYNGKHYVTWNRNTSGNTAMVIPKAPAWRVRLVVNRLKPIIRKELSKINQEKPRFYVIPESIDDEAIAAARAGDAIAEHLIYGKNFRAHRRQASWWAVNTGTGFFKTTVNSEYDIDYGSPSPFHIWVPNIEDPFIQTQPYMYHGLTLSPDEVKERFQVDIEPDTQNEDYHTKFLSAMGVKTKGKELDQVFVKEVWVKSCKEFPNGAMFIMAQNKLLYMEEALPEFEVDPVTGDPVKDEDGNEIQKERMPSNILGGDAPVSTFPYEHGQYPFSKVIHIPTGKFYGESVLVDLIPIQKQYNRSRSQGVEAVNLTSKPQYVTPKGSVDTSKLAAIPGLVIEYTPGFDPPKALVNPELPSHFHADQAQTLNDMDFIANQFEVSQGRTPPGIEAASAIAYLQEESDAILEPTIDSLEEAVEEIGTQSLLLVRQYWPEDKIVKVISGNQVYETLSFKRDMIPEQLDFRVETGSMAPTSRAGKRAFIMELIQNGLIPPMEGLKHIEMSQVSRMYDELQVDARHVDRENFRMKNGIEVVPNEFDNDEAHILYHSRFMKSQIYEGLPQEIQNIFITHYQFHMLRLGRVEENAGAVGIGGPGTQPGPAPTE